MPGYRLRMPAEVHPISAGIKGGIIGGLVMPLPALTYGLLSGHGLWYPVNLLAGMVLPGVGRMSVAELEQFRPVAAPGGDRHSRRHFGRLRPDLRRPAADACRTIPRPLAWGGLLMPVALDGRELRTDGDRQSRCCARAWTGPGSSPRSSCSGSWPRCVSCGSGRLRPISAGLLGGIVGGLLMPIPAVLWSLSSGHGIWYPANLLAGMVLPGLDRMPTDELKQFHANWLAIADRHPRRHVDRHSASSSACSCPGCGPIPAPLTWGGLLMPLLWTAMSYGLMGVVNPLLQQRVDWPWFIVSQFVFGVVAAIVVVRSEKIYIPPAGRGPDSLAEFVAGSGEGQS